MIKKYNKLYLQSTLIKTIIKTMMHINLILNFHVSVTSYNLSYIPIKMYIISR